MRNLTQSETLKISGSSCHSQLVGILAFSLGIIGCSYYFFYPLDPNSFNQDFRILPITISAPPNISV